MSPILVSAGGTTSPHTRGSHHGGCRLRHFVLPDGKNVHIALSPEEADSLRERLKVVSDDEPFDLVINGSPEHLDALRIAHDHHEKKCDTLKQTHGPTYDEIENTRSQKDAFAQELHTLAHQAVSLDANFSKYGYSAELRTFDDASALASSRSSIGGFHDDNHEKKDWAAERRNGRVMKLYKKPVVRQYFHRGLLWRGSGIVEVASFELFIDLLYVGILAINGDHVAEDTTGYELLRFSITFIMSWTIWNDLVVIVSCFETDDVLQRVSVLFVMACLLGLTTNMLDALGETYFQLVTFYLAARLFLGVYYLVFAISVPIVRGVMMFQSFVTVLPSVLWIASIHVELPHRLALIWIALFLDICAPWTIFIVIPGARSVSKRFEDWVKRAFEFYPTINIEHKVERTNAFVTLVFGYAVVSIIYQSSARFGVNAFYGKAVLGLIQSFCMNWIYFELDGTDLFAHAIRRSVVRAWIWNLAHLPFIMSFALGAAALSKLVVATDCPNATLDSLTAVYVEKSEHEIPIGLRWFYCAGLGIALLFMGIISISHIHKEIGGSRLLKRHRLANRFTICVILVCLPLAHGLNSLQLISTVTGLVVWVLFFDLWGASSPKESFFGEKSSCSYTAHCKVPRKDLESAVKGGQTINIKSVSNQGEKATYEVR
ncbi:hypothetical protein BP5796_03060 [Coleophoma crateriformis]|uniref:Low temperature requirement a protein n=1 Tax=Coleophoma crateriformis TaxID=565419 RepID=A0A3D8SM63_9HELO|nr:hypothetical protein BP5796_03060 [Coleophoma crateriformis]